MLWEDNEMLLKYPPVAEVPPNFLLLNMKKGNNALFWCIKILESQIEVLENSLIILVNKKVTHPNNCKLWPKKIPLDVFLIIYFKLLLLGTKINKSRHFIHFNKIK